MEHKVESLPNGLFLVPTEGGLFEKVEDSALGLYLREKEKGFMPAPARKPRKKRGPNKPKDAVTNPAE